MEFKYKDIYISKREYVMCTMDEFNSNRIVEGLEPFSLKEWNAIPDARSDANGDFETKLFKL